MTTALNATLPRVAIVEDDPDLRDSIVEYLRADGYPVWGSVSAEAFYKRLALEGADVVVLDIGLPGEDGLSICQYLREHDRRIGIVFVTARGLRDDRLTGLEAGADAYLVKPVDMEELGLLLKRFGQRIAAVSEAAPAPAGTWRLGHHIWILSAPDGNVLKLTAREHQLLSLLIEAQGEIVAKRHLSEALFGSHVRLGEDRLEVMLSRLRKKGADALGQPLPIRTAHAEGYAFGAPASIG